MKKQGLRYAVAENGLELPVIDVTHPEFALSVTDQQQQELVEQFVRQQEPFERMPEWFRKGMRSFWARRSVLARVLGTADGTYLSGLNTYLLKLGPNNLDAVSSFPLDRRIAASAPVVSIRLRLQDVATLLAQFLAPLLESRPDAPLYLFNIAGGPAMDSLNAILLLKRDHPRLIEGRRIFIEVLDLDTAGPAFGARALSALSEPGAPLHGVNVDMKRRAYDWSRPGELPSLMAEATRDQAVIAVSSEGGLFDYGSDDEIVGNLKMLHDAELVVGSVTRADELMQKMHRSSKVPLKLRGHQAFSELAARAGWQTARVLERPICDQVALVRELPRRADAS